MHDDAYVDYEENRFRNKIGIHLQMIIGFDVLRLWHPFTETYDNDRHHGNERQCFVRAGTVYLTEPEAIVRLLAPTIFIQWYFHVAQMGKWLNEWAER